ncbi:MAG TPA: hypothetical protein IGS52_21985 [Oscillatoriaceae cyanobacterium M33_DOE_052]|uniref:Uncharacterized protein n=1 Tax=Planktothricoides sp. SpSt-374 TaxID=2282167 RepID=A0A7C3ZG02_9CYAN|nr:hypothetical protein [Oscillatoriaceae cyanobacterium M33_DOE_052]
MRNDEREISRKIIKALQKHQRPKFFDTNRLIFAAISSFFVMTIYAAYVWEKQPRVTITDLEVYHNVIISSETNIKMVLEFTTAHLKNRQCKAAAYFYYKNGSQVRSNIYGYQTTDGQLSTGESFRTPYEYSDYNNFTLYIPNKYFQKGDYTATVTTYCDSKFLGNIKTFQFTIGR